MNTDAKKILTHLGEYRDKVNIKIYDTTDSTNKRAKEYGTVSKETPVLFVAKEQTGGRGRLGRCFSSPSGGLYMSLLLRPDLKADDVSLITPAAAVAVCRAIESVTGVNASIKWVNDIFVGNKKVCGILTEAITATDNIFIVVGIGINVYRPDGGFDSSIENIATALYEDAAGAPDDVISILAGAVTKEFLDIYHSLQSRVFVKEYRDRSCVIGNEVTVIRGEESRLAVAFDINENCHLGVRYRDGSEEFLFGGEISLRI